MTITSHHNEKLKEIRKLSQRRRWRERSGRFVAEGEDLLAAADAAGWPAVERFCVAGSGLPGVEVEPDVLASASSLGSGTRALAVYEERWAPRASGPLCLYLHGVSDPGNIGTILRSAQAFGASCVALGPECADPFGPKAVRASMGALFGVPVARVDAVEDLPGVKIALVAGHAEQLSAICPTPRDKMQTVRGGAEAVTLLVGAERAGLPEGVIAQADHAATIPTRTHSLNAAMAATVALYELTRMPPAQP